jgi:hypothetical protein
MIIVFFLDIRGEELIGGKEKKTPTIQFLVFDNLLANA